MSGSCASGSGAVGAASASGGGQVVRLGTNTFGAGAVYPSIAEFVSNYNHGRYHEILSNLTPAGVYFTILLQRERIKRKTFEKRRLAYDPQAV